MTITTTKKRRRRRMLRRVSILQAVDWSPLLLFLIKLLEPQSVLCFSIVVQHPHRGATRQHHRRPSDSFVVLSLSFQQQQQQQQREEQEKENARAGADGYSVLRQPVTRTNWDPLAQPTFSVPQSLRDEKEETFVQRQDSEWWKKTTTTSSTSRQAETRKTRDSNVNVREEEDEDDNKQLDLFQRSLDTLDYPRVLRSLQKQCTSAAARRLVQQAMTMTMTAPVVETTTTKRKNVSNEHQRAYQPLTAVDMQGAQERYQGVKEVQWILNSNNNYDDYDTDSVDLDLEEYSYRNAQGYKQTLANNPMPFISSSASSSSTSTSLDLELILKVANQGRVLEAEEVLDVLQTLDTMETVQNWGATLREVRVPVVKDKGQQGDDKGEILFVELPAWTDCITVNATLQDLLRTAFDKNGGTSGGGGLLQEKLLLSGTTFPALGRLRARVRALRADIMTTLDNFVALPSIKSKLALESGGPLYSEVSGGRLVIPVQAKHASLIGIVHDTSRSGQTVYVEPSEIVSATNELRTTEGELRAEEERIWRMLTQEILHNSIALQTSAMALAQLDLLHARYKLGIVELSGVIPVVKDEGTISLRNAKHPVLILRHVENVVGSDVDLGGANGKNQGLVLTGPNSGGKTIILKLLGLMALMARSGIPVPAQGRQWNRDTDELVHEPRVDCFNPVLADIGDLQSVGGDLSTFSGHMLVCREVLANSGKNALVLMDEVGSGTDPNQGVALAQALLESLIESGARVAITTHFTQLKQLAASDDRFAVGGMQFVNGRPTYKLLPGTVGESFAISVAERLQLPQKVIDRAFELLDSETRQMGELIRELEDQRAMLDEQGVQMQEKQREMAQMEMSIKEEKLRLEKKQLTARRDEAKRFARRLEEKEAILESVLEKLKSDPSRRVVLKSWDDIKFTKRDALNEAENVPSVLAQKKKEAADLEEVRAELVPIAELREKPELNEGDKVVVCKEGALFGQEATIVKSLGGRSVQVRVNNMNVSLKLTDVAIPVKRKKKLQSSANENGGTSGRNSVSKAAKKAIADERKGRGTVIAPVTKLNGDTTTFTMRTESNTVDVRGCNLESAKEQILAKFSSCLMTRRGGGGTVAFILHGHGSGGVLKSKIRNWLSALQKRGEVVKTWQGADVSDGGDAFTRVELR